MNIMEMMQGLSNGTLDAKSEVYNIIKNMSPQQRRNLMGLVPRVEQMARQTGISAEGFRDELSAQLKY